MRLPLQISVAVVVLASAATAQAQMRFQGMDANNDGVITRSEWRGNDNSFRNQDWNGDGVLSGDEVRTGARRQTGWNQDWNRDGRVDNLDNQIAQRFRGYDMNSDSRVGRSEWPGDARLFTRLDANRDGYLLDAGVRAGRRVHARFAQGGPSYRFSNIDVNGDGWVTRNEWNMNSADFNRLDVNRDNRISRFEFENDTAAYNDYRYSAAQFNAFDANRDGWLTRAESGMRTGEFDRLDTQQRQSRQPLRIREWVNRIRYDGRHETAAPRGAQATTAESRKVEPRAAKISLATRVGIWRASASSSGPTPDTHRRWAR